MAKKQTKPKNPILVAIDTTDVHTAKLLVESLAGVVGGIKIGLEFFCANGPVGVCEVMSGAEESARSVAMKNEDEAIFFIDLKFYDIPTTVGRAVHAIMPLEARFLTLHCDGGPKMMEAAVRAADLDANRWKRPMLLGVTGLSSLEIPPETVIARAKSAKDCGFDGIICPPHALASVREELGKTFVLVVPGIRPQSWTEEDDQMSIMVPKQAIEAGADYLVIGRPITKARDPRIAALEIISSLEQN